MSKRKPRLTDHTIYDIAVRTPLETAAKLSAGAGCEVLLKREDLQPVHSFKIRGAYNKIASLTEAERAKGVIAASAGNHAQGVALSAQKLGIDAVIVMPKTAPSIKVEAVEGYGARVELAGDNYSEAAEHCKQRIADTGMTYIAPFDDPLVIEGQGMVAEELLDDRPDITHIFVCVGGGGLLAGIADVVQKRAPHVTVVSVEPEDSNAMQQAITAGKPVELPHVGIFADGVAVKKVGTHTFNIAQQHVDDFITVTTDQTCAAIKSIFEDTRSIVEPAGALAVAGIESYDIPKDAVAVAICSGANMTFERLQFVAERTLLGSGREALYAVVLDEKPDALRSFCETVVQDRNITEFNYRLQTRSEAHIFVGIGTKHDDDKTQFEANLQKQGYTYTDLTTDTVAKQHIRHMVGGPSEDATSEQLFTVGFPERPGALRDFLQLIAENNCNISLFHYRGQGGDVGRVLIGFEAAKDTDLLSLLKHSAYDIQRCNSQSIDIFL